MLTASDYIRRLDVVNRGFRYVSAIKKMRVDADTSQAAITLVRLLLYFLALFLRHKKPKFVSWYDRAV